MEENKYMGIENAQKKLFLEAEPIIIELEKLGTAINSPSDFNKSITNHPEATKIFIRHIDKDYPHLILKMFVMSLSYSTTPICHQLIEMFKKSTNEDLRWQIGNTILILYKKKIKHDEVTFFEIEEILKNEQYGESVSQFIKLACIVGKQKAVPILLILLNSSYKLIITNAIIELGKLKAIEAESDIIKFLDHNESIVRSKAKTALKRIENS